MEPQQKENQSMTQAALVEEMAKLEIQDEPKEVNDDLAKLKVEVNDDLAKLKAEVVEVKDDLAKLKAEVKDDLAKLKAEVKDDLAKLKAEVKDHLAKLEESVLKQLQEFQDTVMKQLQGSRKSSRVGSSLMDVDRPPTENEPMPTEPNSPAGDTKAHF